ncbi:gamma-tubulin complex component 6 [Lepisosteus oculatus]|uniref:gamma-tubulin complex component 6 n=1 Tax=Lepisosteus oculatus TaxID=7918 RepID=UPI003712896B
MAGVSGGSCSITELLGALCDAHLAGGACKPRAWRGGREAARRALRRRAYGALLSRLFREPPPGGGGAPRRPPPPPATPPRNKVLMLAFDLRVAGCCQEAAQLEELLGRLGGAPGGLDSVLELLVQLAGSAPPPAPSYSRDFMRRERPVLRRPPLAGYDSAELWRLEAEAWALVCGEEWGALGGLCTTLGLMEAPPGTGTGLLALGRAGEGRERYEKETRLSLFGALQHTRTSDMEIRLDLPPVPSNAELTGLAIRVPPSLDQSEDEGFQSASNLTPDSQSEPSPSPEPDVWEALRSFEPGRRRCWEGIGCPPGRKELPYLSEAGREAFDQLYQLREGGLQLLSTAAALPPSPLPLHTQTQLVTDVLNVLIGVASTTFPLDQVTVQFSPCPGICVSGVSPDSMQGLLGELAEYGTHYLRLSRFCLQGAHKRGLVFQAFTGALRRYLQYYRACVLCTPPTLSLLAIGFLFRKVGRQLRYLSELCCVDGGAGGSQAVGRSSLASFPVGVKLLSYLYNEAQSNCSNENYAVLLSLLKSSCEPYTRFIYDWVYSGVFRDVYGEFMIQVNEDFLSCRDKQFWTQGYTLISQDVEECVPVFLRHMANDIYVCGKTINLLKICCPQHYICWSELPVPRIAVTFSLQEVEEVERDCAVYRGRMERIACHCATSREEKALRTEQARQELIGQVRESAARTLESIRGRQVSRRLAEEARKRERFEEMKQQLEQDREWRSEARRREQEDDFGFARELRDRERRLQALEEQLERQARKELVEQYSRLSEEAARRERRALWRAHRLRLDSARAQFLEEDRRHTQALLQQFPLGQGRPLLDILPKTQLLTHRAAQSEQQPSQTEAPLLPGQGDQDQREQGLPGSESQDTDTSPETPGAPAPSSSPAAPLPSLGGEPLISEELDLDDFLPRARPAQDRGHSRNHALDAALLRIESDLLAGAAVGPAPVQDYDFSSPFSLLQAEETPPRGSPNLGQGETNREQALCPPRPHIYGHPSTAHIRVGENVSEVEEVLPRPGSDGQPSDSSIPLGQYASEVGLSRPQRSSHGHPSQASVQLGEQTQGSGAAPDQGARRARLSQGLPASEGTVGPDVHTGAASPESAQPVHGREGTLEEGASRPSESTTPLANREGSSHGREAHQGRKPVDPQLCALGLSKEELVDPEPGDHESVTGAVLTPEGRQSIPHAARAERKLDGKAPEAESIDPRHSSREDASDANSKVGRIPAVDIRDHPSSAHFKVGAFVLEQEPQPPAPSVYGHVSDASINVGQHVSEVVAPVPAANRHGHSSDASIKVGGFVSEVAQPRPRWNRHGHTTDARIKVGGYVSEQEPPRPKPSAHGHASDTSLRVGCVVSGTEPSLPTPQPHGHASDTSLQVGCVVSGTAPSLPTPQPHGHASDTSLQVGCVVSGTAPSLPTPQPHGHASDTSLQVGCVVSGTAPSLPTPQPHGHASDTSLQVGCVVSGTEPSLPVPQPHGHASDTSLQVGCVVSGTAPSLPTPQPHGHASDTSLQVGCVVSGTEPSLPTPQPHGHASDSSIKVGQNVAEAPPAPRPRWNVHGHASQSHFRLGVLVSTLQPPQPPPGTPTAGNGQRGVVQGPVGKEEAGAHSNTGQDEAPVQCAEGSPGWSSEQEYLLSLAAQYEVEQYQDNYSLLMAAPDMQLLQQVTRGAHSLLPDPSLRRATDTTAVQLSELVSLPVLMKHSVTAPLITHASLVNKAVVDYFFVELEVERHFEALRHFLLMEDGEFAQSLSDLLFEKLGSGQTPGELLTPFVLNSILTRALQYSLHGDSPLAANFTFALRFLPETFHPHAPDALGCLELRYKVDWPLNIVITDSCMSKYNRLFSFLLQLKHMVWTLRDVWFHLKRAALVKGAGRGGQFRQLQLYRHEMQHFVKVIQGYIANQILQVSWSEFSQRLGSVSDLDAIHRRHADYLNRAIFRGLLTEKAAPVMNIIHSIFSLILKFRTQLIAQPWGCQQGEAEHPNFVAMQHSYRTFKYYSHFLFKVVTKLVNRGYQPHLEDFLLRINFNNYYKDS